jgi:hypothetical protein
MEENESYSITPKGIILLALGGYVDENAQSTESNK